MKKNLIDRHFRTVLDAAPDGVLIECGDQIAYVNPAYARLLHYPSTTELSLATIQDIAHPDELERLRWFGLCRSQGKPAPTRYTFRARARGGDIVTFDAGISLTRVDGDVLITTIVRELQSEPVHTFELPGTKELSPREREVIDLLLEGRRSKEIALMLAISEKTIFTHRSRAFGKLGLRGVADLFRVAMTGETSGRPPVVPSIIRACPTLRWRWRTCRRAIASGGAARNSPRSRARCSSAI